MLTNGTVVMIQDVAYYGYMQHPHKFFLFCGTVMFYGIASPEMFAAIKTELLNARRRGLGRR